MYSEKTDTGKTLYCYKIISHATCTALTDTGYYADHFSPESRIEHYESVWTDLKVEPHSIVRRELSSHKDIQFSNNDGVLQSKEVPILRMDVEGYNDILMIDEIYTNLLLKRYLKCKKYCKMFATISVVAIAFYTVEVLWKE